MILLWTMLALAVIAVVWRVLRYGGVQGAYFGAKVVQTLGTVSGQSRLGNRPLLSVVQLDSETAVAGITFNDTNSSSGRAIVVALSEGESEYLADLLMQAIGDQASPRGGESQKRGWQLYRISDFGMKMFFGARILREVGSVEGQPFLVVRPTLTTYQLDSDVARVGLSLSYLSGSSNPVSLTKPHAQRLIDLLRLAVKQTPKGGGDRPS